jgi:hypothetical protein
MTQTVLRLDNKNCLFSTFYLWNLFQISDKIEFHQLQSITLFKNSYQLIYRDRLNVNKVTILSCNR